MQGVVILNLSYNNGRMTIKGGVRLNMPNSCCADRATATRRSV